MSIIGAGWARSAFWSSAQMLGAALALLVVMPVALTSMKLAVVAIGLFGLVALTLAFGATRMATVMLVLAFGLVNFDNVHVSGSLRIADPFFVLGVLFLLPRLTSAPLRLPFTFIVGASGFVAIGVVSAAVGGNIGSNISYFVSVIKGVVVLPVLLAWWRPKLSSLCWAGSAYVFGNCLNLMASFILGPAAAGRYAGWSSHPNLMGYGQALSIALMPFLFAALPRAVRWLLVPAAIACVWGILLSGSRGALLGAIAVGVLYPALTRSVGATLAVMAAVAPALVIVTNALADPSSTSAVGRLLGSSTGQASDNVREQGAQFGIDQFLHHPLLGGGWATIWGVHTGYVQVAAAIGIFGLACYLLILTAVLRPVVSLPSPYRLLAVPALIAAMVDLVLPVIGAMFEWSVIALAVCAAPLAADAAARRSPGADGAPGAAAVPSPPHAATHNPKELAR